MEINAKQRSAKQIQGCKYVSVYLCKSMYNFIHGGTSAAEYVNYKDLLKSFLSRRVIPSINGLNICSFQCARNTRATTLVSAIVIYIRRFSINNSMFLELYLFDAVEGKFIPSAVQSIMATLISFIYDVALLKRRPSDLGTSSTFAVHIE